MTIGERMMKARKAKKLSRRALSEITWISQNSLASYENEYAEPCLTYAVRIADALGITLDYLARGKADGGK